MRRLKNLVTKASWCHLSLNLLDDATNERYVKYFHIVDELFKVFLKCMKLITIYQINTNGSDTRQFNLSSKQRHRSYRGIHYFLHALDIYFGELFVEIYIYIYCFQFYPNAKNIILIILYNDKENDIHNAIIQNRSISHLDCAKILQRNIVTLFVYLIFNK